MLFGVGRASNHFAAEMDVMLSRRKTFTPSDFENLKDECRIQAGQGSCIQSPIDYLASTWLKHVPSEFQLSAKLNMNFNYVDHLTDL